jgi:hypothetical protein
MIAEFERGACVSQWMEIYAELLAKKGIDPPMGMLRTEAVAA